LEVLEKGFLSIDEEFPFGLTGKMLADQGLDLTKLGNDVSLQLDLSTTPLTLGEVKLIFEGKGSSEISTIFEDLKVKSAFYHRVQEELKKKEDKARLAWTRGVKTHEKEGSTNQSEIPIRARIR
jgi:hypothetical protein